MRLFSTSPCQPPRGGTVRGRLVPLLLIALAARAATLGNPVLHPDEQFYLAAARLWAAGATPFVGVWDRKPLGLFLIYRLPAMVGDPARAVLAYQMLALASATATATMLAAIADRAGWRAGALAGAALYLLWLDLADGQGGQAPVFYTLPMTVAAWLAVGAGHERRRGIAAMALVGMAAQIKYTVVFEGAWLGGWLLWHDRSRGTGRIGYGALLASVAAAPTLIVAGAYALAGHGGDWLFANTTSVLLRGNDPGAERLGNLATCAAILLLPLALAIAGLRTASPEASEADARRFVAGWLAAALVGLALFGTWFNHYTLPVLAPASVAASAMLGDGGKRGPLDGDAARGRGAGGAGCDPSRTSRARDGDRVRRARRRGRTRAGRALRCIGADGAVHLHRARTGEPLRLPQPPYPATRGGGDRR